jgi:hypothetical protein
MQYICIYVDKMADKCEGVVRGRFATVCVSRDSDGFGAGNRDLLGVQQNRSSDQRNECLEYFAPVLANFQESFGSAAQDIRATMPTREQITTSSCGTKLSW